MTPTVARFARGRGIGRGKRLVGRAMQRSDLLCALCLGLLVWGCRQDATPPYTRLSGPAPLLGNSARARANLVVFWASWCKPCRDETPSLRRLAAAPPAGMEVVVVGEDPTFDNVRGFFGGSPPPEWSFRLDDRQVLLEAFRADKLPVAFLVVDGQLVAGFKGVRDWMSGSMQDLLKRLIAESRPSAP